MKKTFSTIIIILLIVSLCLSWAAYNKNNGTKSNNQPDTLARIQQTKVMKVCYAVWPPAVIKDDKTGKLSGHDIDTLEQIAKEIGVTTEYHETTFGNMATAVQTGQCDIGTSLFIAIPRAAVVNFTIPVLYSGISGIIKKGDTRFKTVDDIDKPGIKVAVATGEAGDLYATAHFKQAKIVRIDVESSDLSRFLLEVTSGRADIGIADADTIRLFAATHPEATDAFADNPFNLSPDAYPIRMGDNNFLNFINNSLLYLQTNGTWDQLEKKYDAHWLNEVKQFKMS